VCSQMRTGRAQAQGRGGRGRSRPAAGLLPACCRCWWREGQAGRHLIQQQVDIEFGQGGSNHSAVGTAGGHIFCQRRLQVAGPRLLVCPQQGKYRVVYVLHGHGKAAEAASGGGRRHLSAACSTGLGGELASYQAG
jgi:hypothetical protein